MRAMLSWLLPLAVAGSMSAGCTIDVHDGDDDDWGDPWYESDAGWEWNVDGGIGPWPADDGGINPWPNDGGPPPDDGGPPPDDGGSAPDDGGLASGCEQITVEAVCVVTPQCSPLYNGVDCECYQDGTCSCVSWEFDRCE